MQLTASSEIHSRMSFLRKSDICCLSEISRFINISTFISQMSRFLQILKKTKETCFFHLSEARHGVVIVGEVVRQVDVGHEGHAESGCRCGRRRHGAWRQPHARRNGPLDAAVVPRVRGLPLAGLPVVERLHVLEPIQRRRRRQRAGRWQGRSVDGRRGAGSRV